jgi:hypothetical protein
MARMLESALAASRSVGARLVFPGNVWSYGRGKVDERIDERRPQSGRRAGSDDERRALTSAAGTAGSGCRMCPRILPWSRRRARLVRS